LRQRTVNGRLSSSIAVTCSVGNNIFAWHDVRENPDTFSSLATFKEKEVLHTYSTTFGNGYGDHTIIRGTRGTLYSPGGEGSPQWWFQREPRSVWRTNVAFDSKQGRQAPEPVTIPGHPELAPIHQNDNLKAHSDNWLKCMRTRQKPNGSIDRICTCGSSGDGQP
jgi:hypothetical protein